MQERLTTGDAHLFEVVKSIGLEVTKSEAKSFLSEIERITKEDKTEMPPLIVIIMPYLNMLFPEKSN